MVAAPIGANRCRFPTVVCLGRLRLSKQQAILRDAIMQRLTFGAGLPALLLTASLFAQGPLPGELSGDTTKEDQKTLRDVGLAVDGPALLDYFRKRTFKEANPKEMEALIYQLGDLDFAV